MKRIALLLAVLLLVLGLAAALNWRFVERYVSFLRLGGDALTVPVDWYEPLAPLDTGQVGTLPRALRPTIPVNALEQASDYAREQGSLALLVARLGRIEYEEYWDGFTEDDWFNPQSMSKTVLGMAVGIAVDEGHLKVSDPIGQYVTEWAGDPRGEITIENLLQMSGGLEQISRDYRPVPWSRGVWQHFGSDFDSHALDLDLVDSPGTRFDYNNNESQLLGLALERATGLKYPDFLSLRLWQPLGLGPAAMYLDRPRGRVMKSCCILSRPVDWLALGQLLLNNGSWRGRQIISAEWVRDMTTPASTYEGYGYQVWLGDGSLWHIGNHPGPEVYTWWGSEPYAEDGVYAFLGYGYQNVWVVPSLDLVILRAAREWPPNAWDVSRIPNLLIRALRDPAGFNQ